MPANASAPQNGGPRADQLATRPANSVVTTDGRKTK